MLLQALWTAKLDLQTICKLDGQPTKRQQLDLALREVIPHPSSMPVDALTYYLPALAAWLGCVVCSRILDFTIFKAPGMNLADLAGVATNHMHVNHYVLQHILCCGRCHDSITK